MKHVDDLITQFADAAVRKWGHSVVEAADRLQLPCPYDSSELHSALEDPSTFHSDYGLELWNTFRDLYQIVSSELPGLKLRAQAFADSARTLDSNLEDDEGRRWMPGLRLLADKMPSEIELAGMFSNTAMGARDVAALVAPLLDKFESLHCEYVDFYFDDATARLEAIYTNRCNNGKVEARRFLWETRLVAEDVKSLMDSSLSSLKARIEQIIEAISKIEGRLSGALAAQLKADLEKGLAEGLEKGELLAKALDAYVFLAEDWLSFQENGAAIESEDSNRTAAVQGEAANFQRSIGLGAVIEMEAFARRAYSLLRGRNYLNCITVMHSLLRDPLLAGTAMVDAGMRLVFGSGLYRELRPYLYRSQFMQAYEVRDDLPPLSVREIGDLTGFTRMLCAMSRHCRVLIEQGSGQVSGTMIGEGWPNVTDVLSISDRRFINTLPPVAGGGQPFLQSGVRAPMYWIAPFAAVLGPFAHGAVLTFVSRNNIAMDLFTALLAVKPGCSIELFHQNGASKGGAGLAILQGITDILRRSGYEIVSSEIEAEHHRLPPNTGFSRERPVNCFRIRVSEWEGPLTGGPDDGRGFPGGPDYDPHGDICAVGMMEMMQGKGPASTADIHSEAELIEASRLAEVAFLSNCRLTTH